MPQFKFFEAWHAARTAPTNWSKLPSRAIAHAIQTILTQGITRHFHLAFSDRLIRGHFLKFRLPLVHPPLKKIFQGRQENSPGFGKLCRQAGKCPLPAAAHRRPTVL